MFTCSEKTGDDGAVVMTMMNKNVQRRLWLILALLAMALAASSLTGCVDQNRGEYDHSVGARRPAGEGGSGGCQEKSSCDG